MGWAMTCAMGDFKLDVWQCASAQQQAVKLCPPPTVNSSEHRLRMYAVSRPTGLILISWASNF